MAKKRGKRRVPKKPDPLNIQTRVLVRRGMKVTAQQLADVMNEWVQTGKTPNGFQVSVVNWQNPDRKGGKDDWRTSAKPGESVERARQTLRLRSWLRYTAADFQRMGKG